MPRSSPSPRELGPALVALTGSVALLAHGASRGRANWQVYAVVLLLGGAAILALHRRVGFSAATLWGLAAFGVGHAAGGMIAVGDGILYQWWLVDGLVRYDNVQHAVGFGAVCRATWEVLRRRLSPRPDDLAAVAAWIVVLGAAAFGAANEIVEWVMTLVLPETSVGGYDNTARDLVANLVGGIVAALLTYRGLLRGGSGSTFSGPAAATDHPAQEPANDAVRLRPGDRRLRGRGGPGRHRPG